MRRAFGPLAILLFGCGFAISAAGDGLQMAANAPPVQSPPPAPDSTDASIGSPGIDASSVLLPCTPVAAYWTGPPQSEGMPPGPELAVASIDVRPKDARLYLDDRFVGRARYLDGRPGYLYLAPGEYHLELRLDGYETVAVDLTAESGCRFDLKHRLQRIEGTAKEDKSETVGKGKPFNRVFSPRPEVQRSTAAPVGGPNPALRPALTDEDASTERARPIHGATLRLSVKPATASISIDGDFLATARELDRMEGPLAVSAGSHLIEVTAPGHRGQSRNIEIEDGEIIELSVELPAAVEDAR